MNISRIVVRNFRNFELLDVPIRPGVTCVLGENNTGKSNLFHSLRLVLDVGLSSALRVLTENDLHRCVGYAHPTQVLVSVEFSNYAANVNECALCGLWEVGNDLARITYRFRPRESVREALESGERADDSLTLEDYGWELCGGSAGDEHDPATVTWSDSCGQSIRFQELQALKVDFMPALRDVENDLRNSRVSPLARLISALDIHQDEKDALVEIIRTANNNVEGSATIHTAGTAIETSFGDTAGEAFAMPLRLGMIAPTFASIQRSLGVLLTDRDLVDFEPSRNGLGLNNILYVSMLLEYFRRRIARPDTAGQLLLMEEPEAHLHPQLQRALYAKLHESPFQTLVSTHSTHISSGSELDSYVVLTAKLDMGTASMVPSGITNLSAGEKADLERYLDATRSSLLFARKVMLVEGPAELFVIPLLVKAVMNIDLERHGISVIPIHGVHFGPYAKLFSEEALNKKCAIVTDDDMAANNPTEDDEEDEEAEPQSAGIRNLENPFMKVFSFETTFEKALVVRGMLAPLHAACQEFEFPRITGLLAAAVTAAQNRPTWVASPALQTSVLNTAIRVGKGRFAQVLSKHLHAATGMPQYIRDAVTWLMINDPDNGTT